MEQTTEIDEIINSICKKFNYPTQDTENNKSLGTILKKIVPIIIKDASVEDKASFIKMLQETPIVFVNSNTTEEEIDKIAESMYGKSNIEQIDNKQGEYGKNIAPAAFVTTAYMEGKEVKGKNFLYVARMSESDIARNVYNSDINISYLVHELGHAWNSQKGGYSIDEEGNLENRVGTATMKYKMGQKEDGTYLATSTETKGLFLEEAVNTIFEEDVMAQYFNVNIDQMKRIYQEKLLPSEYQGMMEKFMRTVIESLGSDEIKKYRMNGNKEEIKGISELMKRTEEWKNFKETTRDRFYKGKMEAVKNSGKPVVEDFFAKYQDVFFQDSKDIEPIDRIDNVLEQMFDVSGIRTKFNSLDKNEIDKYGQIVLEIQYDGYVLTHQAQEIQNMETIETEVPKEIVQGEISPQKAVEVIEDIVQGKSTEKIMNEKKTKEKESEEQELIQ